MLLKIKGHEVSSARDGFEAIDKANVPADVHLMDVGMPKLNGYEATRRIRDLPHGRDICIVALTGWSQPSDVEKSAEAGCTATIW